MELGFKKTVSNAILVIISMWYVYNKIFKIVYYQLEISMNVRYAKKDMNQMSVEMHVMMYKIRTVLSML